MPLSRLLFQLFVTTSNSVDLRLILDAFIGLGVYCLFHLIYFRLSLPNVILDFVHLLSQVVHCTFLQVDPALHFFDLIVHALDHDVLRFAAILCLHSRLHAELLVAPILEL